MTPPLTCDDCGASTAELREINAGEIYASIICAACFVSTAEASECNFTDFPMAQEASE